MKTICVVVALICAMGAAGVAGDLLDCDDRKMPQLSDIPLIGPKFASGEVKLPGSGEEHEVRDFFKDIGCQIKMGATKVTEQAKKLGVEIKERAKVLGERAKDLGTDWKEKFNNFKDRVGKDSSEELSLAPMREVPANVEIIDPDLLKSQQEQGQECGHGYLLDAMGNCKKLKSLYA